jgi:hypothetical protein
MRDKNPLLKLRRSVEQVLHTDGCATGGAPSFAVKAAFFLTEET